jgi:N-acetylneuraminic acid mutarotase
MNKIASLLSLALLAGGASAQTWTSFNNFPGANASYRKAGISALVGNNAYIGLGVSQGTVLNDFWQVNLTTKAWTQLPNFPGTNRYDAVAFVIGTNIYVGTGDENIKDIEGNTGYYRDDFYVFNTSTIPGYKEPRFRLH